MKSDKKRIEDEGGTKGGEEGDLEGAVLELALVQAVHPEVEVPLQENAKIVRYFLLRSFPAG